MPKTFQSEKHKIEQQFAKKSLDLRRRIEAKYEGKVEREYQRKKARLDKQLADKVHNLKIELPIDKRIRKIRVKKPVETDYAIACKLAQLLAKLYYTDATGRGECICCPGEFFEWDLLDGGHRIPKAKSRITALVWENIHAQRKSCNSNWGGKGNYEKQIPQINKIHGDNTTERLLELTYGDHDMKPKEYIITNIPILEELLEHKTFDISKQITFLEKLKRRYLGE